MASRYLDGERPRPADAARSALGTAWTQAWAGYSENFERYLLHDALGSLWDFVAEANRFVDREQPWLLAKQARNGDTAAAESDAA